MESPSFLQKGFGGSPAGPSMQGFNSTSQFDSYLPSCLISEPASRMPGGATVEDGPEAESRPTELSSPALSLEQAFEGAAAPDYAEPSAKRQCRLAPVAEEAPQQVDDSSSSSEEEDDEEGNKENQQTASRTLRHCGLSGAFAHAGLVDTQGSWQHIDGHVTSAEQGALSNAQKALEIEHLDMFLRKPLTSSIETLVCGKDSSGRRVPRPVSAAVENMMTCLRFNSSSTAGHADSLWGRLESGFKAVSYDKQELERVVWGHVLQLARRWAALSPAADADTAAGRRQLLVKQGQRMVAQQLLKHWGME